MSIAAAVRTKKAAAKGGKKKGDPDQPATAAAASPPPESVEVLEATLADLRKKREKADGDYRSHDKVPAIERDIADVTARLEAARVRAMPAPVPVASALRFEERTIDVAAIMRTGNHRDGDHPAQVEQLSRSLQTHGLQQRIGVRDVVPEGLPRLAGVPTYELIFGSRRLGAAGLAGWTEIAAKVYPSTLTPADVEILRTVENFGRRELNGVERALAIARVIDSIEAMIALLDGYPRVWLDRDRTGLLSYVSDDLALVDVVKLEEDRPDTAAALRLARAVHAAGGIHAYVGLQLGYPTAWVKDHAYVSRLGGEARALLSAGRITLAHARELAVLGDPGVADSIAGMVAKRADGTGGNTVEQAKNWVADRLRSLKTTPWRLDVIVGRADDACTGHACATCPHNSKTDADLFGGSLTDEPEAGFCTNDRCFKRHTTLADAALDRFVQLTRKEVKKRPELAITETNLAGVLREAGDFLKPSSAVRRAKKELEPAEAKSGEKETAGGGRYQEPKKTPEQKAREKHGEAVGEWARGVLDAIGTAAVGRPGATTVLRYVIRTDAFEACVPQSYPEPPEAALRACEKRAESAAVKQLLRDLAEPTIVGIGELERLTEADQHLPSIYEVRRWPLALTKAVADMLGVEVPPRPELASFLPDGTDRVPAAPAKTSAAAGRKGKGKGSLPPAKLADDPESDGDAGDVDDWADDDQGDDE